jgi:hypothetical protein
VHIKINSNPLRLPSSSHPTTTQTHSLTSGSIERRITQLFLCLNFKEPTPFLKKYEKQALPKKEDAGDIFAKAQGQIPAAVFLFVGGLLFFGVWFVVVLLVVLGFLCWFWVGLHVFTGTVLVALNGGMLSL